MITVTGPGAAVVLALGVAATALMVVLLPKWLVRFRAEDAMYAARQEMVDAYISGQLEVSRDDLMEALARFDHSIENQQMYSAASVLASYPALKSVPVEPGDMELPEGLRPYYSRLMKAITVRSFLGSWSDFLIGLGAFTFVVAKSIATSKPRRSPAEKLERQVRRHANSLEDFSVRVA